MGSGLIVFSCFCWCGFWLSFPINWIWEAYLVDTCWHSNTAGQTKAYKNCLHMLSKKLLEINFSTLTTYATLNNKSLVSDVVIAGCVCKWRAHRHSTGCPEEMKVLACFNPLLVHPSSRIRCLISVPSTDKTRKQWLNLLAITYHPCMCVLRTGNNRKFLHEVTSDVSQLSRGLCVIIIP